MSSKVFDDVSINPHIAKELGIPETYLLSILTKYYVENGSLKNEYGKLIEIHFFIDLKEQNILIESLLENGALYNNTDNSQLFINFDLQCDLLGLNHGK